MTLKKIITEKNEKDCSITLIVSGTKRKCESIKKEFNNKVFNWEEREIGIKYQISGIYSIRNSDLTCSVVELEKLINELENDGWKCNFK